MKPIKKPFYEWQARNDIDTIATFIALDNLEAAGRFYDKVEETAELLAKFPHMGCQRNFVSNELYDVRIFHVLGFDKHLLFYRETERTIEVIRVVHGARDLPTLFQ